MAWFRVDDTFTFNAKTVECSNSAIGAWTLAGAWSCQQLTDGFIPKQMLRLLRVDASDASELVAAGLWKEVEAGYQFHDWNHYQPSAKQIRTDRAELREKRAESGRKGGVASGKARREASASFASKQEVEASRSPIPSHPIPSPIYNAPDDDPDFLAFWSHYPRKDDRIKAHNAWKKATKQIDPQTLIQAAQAYSVEVQGREKKYIKLGASWLNAGSWENDYTPEPTPQQEMTRDQRWISAIPFVTDEEDDR